MINELPLEYPSDKYHESKIRMAFEYVKPSPGEALVMVRQYQTVYHADGKISHEVSLKGSLFEKTVQAFKGRFSKSKDSFAGLFDAPEEARLCARKISYLYGQAVDVQDRRITMRLKGNHR